MSVHNLAPNSQEYMDSLLANGQGSEAARAFEHFDVPTFIEEAIADLSVAGPATVLERIFALPLLAFTPEDQAALYNLTKCVQRLVALDTESCEVIAILAKYLQK